MMKCLFTEQVLQGFLSPHAEAKSRLQLLAGHNSSQDRLLPFVEAENLAKDLHEDEAL